MVMDCWVIVGDGGRSILKCFDMLRPGCVARLRLEIIASDASDTVSLYKEDMLSGFLPLPGALHIASKLEFREFC
jgi:hypothetical protein